MAVDISAWLQAQWLQGSAAADRKGEHEKPAIWYTYSQLTIQKSRDRSWVNIQSARTADLIIVAVMLWEKDNLP